VTKRRPWPTRRAIAAWDEARARQRAEKLAQPILVAPQRRGPRPGARRLWLKLRKKRARQWHNGVRMLIRTKLAIEHLRAFLDACDETATYVTDPVALLRAASRESCLACEIESDGSGACDPSHTCTP
jgi:hypothetical protein